MKGMTVCVMVDMNKLCPACLSERDENGVCRRCRTSSPLPQRAPLLAYGTELSGRYYVSKALKKDTEGVTYLAFDMRLEKPVSLREYFPGELALRGIDNNTVAPKMGRDYDYALLRDDFRSLWNKLHKLSDLTALITVTNVFSQNNTIYAVYDEPETVTLRDYLLSNRDGSVSWEKARMLFMPVLSTLGTLHSTGLIHGGITPETLIFTKDGHLKLSGFQTRPARVDKGIIEPNYADGYTPYEQYVKNAVITPAADIYSFTAVLCRSLTGSTPIDSKSRAQNDRMMIPSHIAEKLPPYVINAVINGMQIEARDRTRNAEQLRANLSASPAAVEASAKPDADSFSLSDDFDSSFEDIPDNVPGATKHISALRETKRPSRPAEKRPERQPEIIVDPLEHGKGPTPGEELMFRELEKEKRKTKKLTLISVILGISTLCFAVLFFSFGVTTSDAPQGTGSYSQQDSAYITVNNFVGYDKDSVMTNPDYVGKYVFIPEQEYSSTVPVNAVVRQSPPAGATAKPGEQVILYYSCGPRAVVVEQLAGKTYEEAETILKALKVQIAVSYKQTSDMGADEADALAGKVAETIPAAGREVREGDVVTVVLYLNRDGSLPEISGGVNESTSVSTDDNSFAEYFNTLY